VGAHRKQASRVGRFREKSLARWLRSDWYCLQSKAAQAESSFAEPPMLLSEYFAGSAVDWPTQA